jgi:hypothetical protein
MADYYSILNKTISGLPAKTAENRKLVFAKARMAIDRQLRAVNPPLSEDAVGRHMAALEAAIERIEAEHAVTNPAAAAATPAVQPTRIQPQQIPSVAQVSVAAHPVQPAAQQPGVRPAVQQSGVRPAVQQSGVRPAVQQPGVRSAPLAGSGPAPVTRSALQNPSPVSRPVQPAAAQRPQVSPLPVRPKGEPQFDPPAFDTSLDAVGEVDRPVRIRPAPAARSYGEPARRSSGATTTAIVSLVLVLLLAAGAYALWRNKEPLLAAIGLGGGAVAEPVPADSATPAPANAEQKEEARLGDSKQPAEGTDGAENGTPAPDAKPAQAETTTQAEQPTGAANGETNAAQPQVKPVEEAGSSALSEQPAPTQSSLPAGVAQKAYLYEEGTASGSGATRDDAAIVWTLDSQPAGDGLPAEPVIKGRLEVPGRGLVMDISIKRNVDEALPASHLIELVFVAPPDFSGGSIDNVARFVMKANEQARGEGLVAVPAKIDTGIFLIALNNLDQAKETNKRLLLESSWIDIPVGYTTGRRALVTLEKGAAGERLFREAFDAWDKN